MNKFIQKNEKKVDRFLEFLPGFLAWGLILSPAIGGLFFPNIIAYGIMIFITYWFIKSFKSAFYSILGYVLVNEWEKVNWYKRWKRSKEKGKLYWDDIKHVIIIPNYNETEEKLVKITYQEQADHQRDSHGLNSCVEQSNELKKRKVCHSLTIWSARHTVTMR